MVGTVNDFVRSFIWPWLVAAATNARFGMVSVGTEQNQWSHTA